MPDLSINISEMIWTVINFLILMFLLDSFLFKPLLKFMDEHKSRIKNALADGEKSRQAMEENAILLAEKLHAVEREANLLLSKARANDEQIKAKALNEARQDASDIRSCAEERIKLEEKVVRKNIEEKMPELVSALIFSLLGDEKVVSRNMELIGSFVASSYMQ